MDCVPEPPPKQDFVQKACSAFLQDRVNIRKALYLLELEDPRTLFSRDLECKELRSATEITHLFLCLCQYHDWFDGCLTGTLSHLMSQNITNNVHKILIQTLYITILSVKKDWIELEECFGPHTKLVEPKFIISASPDLFFFCKAMSGYAHGAFFGHQSFVKEVDVDSLVEKRKTALDSALKSLSGASLSVDWKRVRVYFSIKVLLVMARSICSLNPSEMSALQTAYELCRKAKNLYTPQAVILEPE